jgi:hypothetical protein
MTTETERSPREIAQEIILTGGKHAHGSIMCFERNALADAIDRALRDRDERAAKIADAEHARLYHGVDYGDEDDSPAFRIASAIRGTNK